MPPAQPFRKHLMPQGCRLGQPGRPADAIGTGLGRHPYLVTRNLRGIGKEKEGPGRQRRVQDIHSRPPEDLLTDDDPEGNAHGYLPQGDGWRQGQGEEHSRHQESLVDLVLADGSEKSLAVAPDQEGDQQHGEVVERSVKDAGQQVAGIEPVQSPAGHQGRLPGFQRQRPLGDGPMGLVAGVVHGHEHRWNESDDHGHHQALQVESIPDMGAAPGDLSRRIQKAVEGFVEGIG